MLIGGVPVPHQRAVEAGQHPTGIHVGSAAGRRIRDLAVKLDQLKARRDELAQLTGHQPAPPDPTAIEQLRRHLADVLTHGTPGQRKAIIETHIAEIKIDGTRLIPIFMIPTGDSDGPAESSTEPEFRTMVRVVELRGLEPLTPSMQRGLGGSSKIAERRAVPAVEEALATLGPRSGARQAPTQGRPPCHGGYGCLRQWLCNRAQPMTPGTPT
jgi:hypothetical protein